MTMILSGLVSLSNSNVSMSRLTIDVEDDNS